MEQQTQPLKKRAVEVPTDSSEQREIQRTSRIREYSQYVPISHVSDQALRFAFHRFRGQRQLHGYSQRQRLGHRLTQTHHQSPQGQIQSQSRRVETQTSSQSQSLAVPPIQRAAQSTAQSPPQTTAQSPPQFPARSQTEPSAQPPPQSPPQSSPQRPPQAPAQSPGMPQPMQQYHAISQLQTQIRPPTQLQLHLQNLAQSQPQAAPRQIQSQVQSLIELQNPQERRTTDNGIQIIEHIYREPPMMLNAWTQTTTDDQQAQDLNIATLLAKIDTLEESLQESYDYINSNLNVTIRSAPDDADEEIQQEYPASSSLTTPPQVKDEIQTYTILSQGGDANGDGNIEIELSVLGSEEVVNNENIPPPPPNVKKIRKQTTKAARTVVNNETFRPQSIGQPKPIPEGEVCICIGPNGTKVPEVEFNSTNWTSPSCATRKLLTTIFSRETLATHSMTGKASPAFKDQNKPVKGRLEPTVVEDIIDIVSTRCKSSTKEVRSAITTKCADENKMMKLKQPKDSNDDTPSPVQAPVRRPILGELRSRRTGQVMKINANA